MALIVGGEPLAFYKSFDYGAVFYWLGRIPVAGQSLDELHRTPGFRYLLMWESEWKSLQPEAGGRLDLVERSKGTGPDARNPLVLARFVDPR